MENVEQLALRLGCRVARVLSTNYLGLALGGFFKSLPVWDPVEGRFKKRLSQAFKSVDISLS